MKADLLTLIPSDKYDLKTAKAAVAAGYPTVKPIIFQLLEWTQDANWPVAQILMPFFAGIGAELAPYIRTILETNDEVWKYFFIQCVIAESPSLCADLQIELEKIAQFRTESEHKEEVDLVAQEALKNI